MKGFHVTGTILQYLMHMCVRMHREEDIHSPFPRALSGTSRIYGGTYNPSTSIRGHITVNIQCLSLITIYVDGVETRGGVAIQHCLRAVPGEWVQESNCGMKKKCDSGRRGRWVLPEQTASQLGSGSFPKGKQLLLLSVNAPSC